MPKRNQSQRPMRSGSLGRAIRYLYRYRWQALLPYLFMVIATAAQLGVPRLIRNMIDSITEGYIANQMLPFFDQIPAIFLPQILTEIGMTEEELRFAAENAERLVINAALLVLALAIVRGIFAFLQVYLGESISQSVSFDMRNELFAKIQTLSFSYHDQMQTGQLMIRATDDVDKVRLFIGQGLILAVQSLLLLVGTLVILFTTNVRLTWVVLPILPVALVLFMVFGGVSQPLFVEVQQRLSALNTILQENLAGIKVIKAFVRERKEQATFRQATFDVMNQQIKISRIFSFLFPIIFLAASFGQAFTLYFGGRQILEATLSLGEWQEFSLYLVYLFLPTAQLGIIITQLAQAAASANRIFEILDTKNEVSDKPNAIELPPVQGQVTFENVSFRYFNSGTPVLSQINFTAQPGQTIALLGATGSGKTTIINLLPRFYDPSEGRVLIDGYDLREITLDSLRSQIGIVLQETTLFTGSIQDNIAFGRPNATLAEVMEAAKAAEAHDFIQTMSLGYQTPVGERGTTLSGGQKQRIAIARALLLNPHILILDDSTSSVDLTTEYKIQKSLDQLMKGRTSFVIAQRISTVLNADLILVLDKGQIVAQGTHEMLLEENPIYAEIYHSQLVDDATPESQMPASAVSSTMG